MSVDQGVCGGGTVCRVYISGQQGARGAGTVCRV